MADLLNSICEQIDARLKELRPIAEEAAGLQAALAALDGTGPAVVASQSVRGTRQRRARPGPVRVKRGRTREQLVDYVRANPGSTAGEVAKALGLERDSVATRLARLAKSGDLAKAARGYSAP
jgi:Winged helix-turn-helix DNA-binding